MSIAGIELSKTYQGRKVLDKVSISCAAGEICGLLGANGAGKTTLFKILFGLVTPDSGKVQLPDNVVKPIGGIIEKPALYEYLNAHDNIHLFSSIQGLQLSKNEIAEQLQKVGLPVDRIDPVANFSMGMKQRLGIAIALLNNPSCLVLDEPFTGLDPMGVSSLRNLITTLAQKEGLAIILSSHIMDELSKLCHRLYVLKNGQLVNSGLTQDLIAANTMVYSICAPGIHTASCLTDYTVSFKGNCALVTIEAAQVSALIQALHQENIFITSCTPELSMEKLFETHTECTP